MKKEIDLELAVSHLKDAYREIVQFYESNGLSGKYLDTAAHDCVTSSLNFIKSYKELKKL